MMALVRMSLRKGGLIFFFLSRCKKSFQGGAPQTEEAPQRVLRWNAWDAGAPLSLQLVDFYAITTICGAPQRGPTAAVHVQFLEAFQAAVSAHRKASDDHIRVTGELRRRCL